MIKLIGNKLVFTGKDEATVRKFAMEHKLSFKQVVYLALMNGIAKGKFNEKTKNSRD